MRRLLSPGEGRPGVCRAEGPSGGDFALPETREQCLETHLESHRVEGAIGPRRPLGTNQAWDKPPTAVSQPQRSVAPQRRTPGGDRPTARAGAHGGSQSARLRRSPARPPFPPAKGSLQRAVRALSADSRQVRRTPPRSVRCSRESAGSLPLLCASLGPEGAKTAAGLSRLRSWLTGNQRSEGAHF